MDDLQIQNPQLEDGAPEALPDTTSREENSNSGSTQNLADSGATSPYQLLLLSRALSTGAEAPSPDPTSNQVHQPRNVGLLKRVVDAIGNAFGVFDADKAARYLNAHATMHSRGECAHFVALAVDKACGTALVDRPGTAAGYIDYLDKGQDFGRVDRTTWTPDTAQKGDIVVFPATQGHPDGHIQMCVGQDSRGHSVWRSDFHQKGFIVNEAYENSNYVVYRHNSLIANASDSAAPKTTTVAHSGPHSGRHPAPV